MPCASVAFLLQLILLSAHPFSGAAASAAPPPPAAPAPAGEPACKDRSLEFGGLITAATGIEEETCPSVVPIFPSLYSQTDPTVLLTKREACLTTLGFLSAALSEAGISWTPPAPFSPASFVADVCASTCASSGAYASNCTQAPPSPPLSPPLPLPPVSPPEPAFAPFSPFPAGLTTVRSATQLRAALANGVPMTLFVPEGHWLLLGGEALTVSSNISLLSTGVGATIDAQSLSRVAEVAPAGRLELRSLHLVNGATSPSSLIIDGREVRPITYGGAVLCYGALLLVNARITNSSAFDTNHCEGGAVYVVGGSVSISGSTISDCTVKGGTAADGGALSVHSGSVSVSNSNITGCVAKASDARGGALALVVSSVSIISSIISGCESSAADHPDAKAFGGAIYTAGGSLRVSGSTMSRSSCVSDKSARGGAMHIRPGFSRHGVEEGVSLTMSDSIVNACICALPSTSTSTNTEAWGGAIFVTTSGFNTGEVQATLHGLGISSCGCVCDIARGGALAVHFQARCSISMSDSIINDCHATSNCQNGNILAYGGALSVASSAASVTISGSIITNCTAVSECAGAAGLLAALDSEAGGGVHAEAGTIMLTRTLLSGNAAPTGANVMVIGGSIAYVLPLIAGHWLPNSVCLVNREPCPWRDKDCASARAACSTVVNGSNCRLPTFVSRATGTHRKAATLPCWAGRCMLCHTCRSTMHCPPLAAPATSAPTSRACRRAPSARASVPRGISAPAPRRCSRSSARKLTSAPRARRQRGPAPLARIPT